MIKYSFIDKLVKKRGQRFPEMKIFYPHFYLQAVQMQVHLANGVMGGEAWRGAPISAPL
jgi:hypothetical protein